MSEMRLSTTAEHPDPRRSAQMNDRRWEVACTFAIACAHRSELASAVA